MHPVIECVHVLVFLCVPVFVSVWVCVCVWHCSISGEFNWNTTQMEVYLEDLSVSGVMNVCVCVCVHWYYLEF